MEIKKYIRQGAVIGSRASSRVVAGSTKVLVGSIIVGLTCAVIADCLGDKKDKKKGGKR